MNLEPRSKTAPKIFTHFKSKGWLMSFSKEPAFQCITW